MRCKICGSEGVMEMQTMYELLGIHKKVDKEKQNVENSKNNNQSVLKGRFKIQNQKMTNILLLVGRVYQ